MSEPLRWDERPEDLRAPAMVLAFRGWNDAATAASSALAVMGERLKAHRVAAIDAEEFYDFQTTRPLIDLATDGGRRIAWPEVEIAVARAPEAPRDLLLVAGAEPSMRWRAFTALLLDAASELGVRRVVTLGSLLADVLHTDPVRLTGITSDSSLIAGLGMRVPSYTGPTGIVGVIQQSAGDRGFEAVSLWAPVSHYAAGLVNAKASLELVRAVRAVTGVGVATDDLESAARTFEERVSQAVEADPRLRAMIDRLREESEQGEEEQGPLPTGDELAAELERYLRERGEGEPPA